MMIRFNRGTEEDMGILRVQCDRLRVFVACACMICAFVLCGCAEADAQKAYEEAEQHMAVAEYAEAAEDYRLAIDTNPDRAEYSIGFAESRIAVGEYTDALAELNRVYSDKDNQIVRENNKQILREKGIIAIKQRDYEGALKCFDEASGIEERRDLDFDILQYKGYAYMHLGRYEDALDIYSKLIDGKKTGAELYAARAAVYAALGKVNEAEADYRSALVFENSFKYNVGLYNLYSENGMEDKAYTVLQETHLLQPSGDEDKYNLAVVHYLCGDFDAALGELEEAAAKGYTGAYLYLGHICLAARKYDKAKTYYGLYAENEVYIEDVSYFDGLSQCLCYECSFDEALSVADKGLKTAEGTEKKNLLMTKLSVYEQQKEYTKAKLSAQELAAGWPDDERVARELTLLDYIVQ